LDIAGIGDLVTMPFTLNSAATSFTIWSVPITAVRWSPVENLSVV